MTITAAEARAQLRVAMAGWPRVDASTAAFLASLPWQIRQAVVMVCARGYTLDGAGRELCVSRRTVSRYISEAYRRYNSNRS